MNHYRVFGLALASAIPFPELDSTAARRAAVHFDLAPAVLDDRGWTNEAPRLQSNGEPWLTVARRDGAYRLRFAHDVDFVLQADGRSVTAYRRRRTPLAVIRHLFLNQALPLVLGHRGYTVLHASAFAHDRGAVALVGPTGAGKSTLAASFGAAGSPVIADDAVVIRRRNERLTIAPSYASLRLWPDALRAVARRCDARVSPNSPKRRIGPDDGRFRFAERPAPLLRAYLLDARRARATRIHVEPLSRRDTLLELIKCSYVLDVTDRAALVAHLDRLTGECLPVGLRRVTYPRDLAALSRVREAILADIDRSG